MLVKLISNICDTQNCAIFVHLLLVLHAPYPLVDASVSISFSTIKATTVIAYNFYLRHLGHIWVRQSLTLAGFEQNSNFRCYFCFWILLAAVSKENSFV